MTIFYVVTHPDNFRLRYGRIGTLAITQDNNGAQLDLIWNDCYQIYPRPYQKADPDHVVLKLTLGPKMQAFLADQTGSENPFYDEESVQMLDVYNQFFGSLEKLKEEWPDLAGTIDVEFVDEDGNTQTKTIPIMEEEHKWAGDAT